MRKFIVTVLATISTFCMQAQLNLDSLKKEFNQMPGDTATIRLILNKSKEYRRKNLDAFLLINKVAEEKAIQSGDGYFIASTSLNVGIAYIDMSNSVEASVYFLKAKEMAEKINNGELNLKVTAAIGSMYHINHETTKALEYYTKALAISIQMDNKLIKANMLANIGGIYYEKSESKNPFEKKEALIKAISYCKQAVNLAMELRDTSKMLNQMNNLSMMYSDTQEYDSAYYYLTSVKKLIDEKPDSKALCLYYGNMARLAREEKKIDQAILYYKTAIGFAKELNAPEWIFENYLALAQTYEDAGDNKNALENYKKYLAIRDSSISEENFAKAADIQNQYQREKKDKELLQKDLELKTASAKRNRLLLLLISSLTVLSLLGIFSFLLIRSIKARKKAYTELENRNEEIKEQALQLSRQARLIAKFQSQMNPHFTFNALHNIYGLVIGNENEKAVTQIQSLAGLMRKTLTNSVKEEITIEEEMDYLQKYIDFEQAAAPAKFDFTIEVDAALENALIPPMMIQPFIENAIKHAELDKVKNPFIKIFIQKEKDLMKLIIEDNGKGLDKENINITKLSHSMSIIKSRLELLFQGKNNAEVDGLLTVKSLPETTAGTTIKFYLPLAYSY